MIDDILTRGYERLVASGEPHGLNGFARQKRRESKDGGKPGSYLTPNSTFAVGGGQLAEKPRLHSPIPIAAPRQDFPP
jgi:hypothetical protein